jgi:hypothetical protein
MKRKIKATQACAFVAQQAQHLVKKQAQQAHPVLKKNGMKNGIPQIRTEKCSTIFDPAPGSPRPVFGPVSVYPRKNENGREKMVYGCGRNGIHPVRFHPCVRVELFSRWI